MTLVEKFDIDHRAHMKHISERYCISIHFNTLSTDYYLSEEFIEKKFHSLPHHLVSKYQILSERLMEKYYSEWDWDYISKYQKMSIEFIKRMNNLGLIRFFWYADSQYMTNESFKEFEYEIHKSFIKLRI